MAKTKTFPKVIRPKSKRTKTAHLPGMEPPRIAEIDSAADKYYDAMRERMDLSKQESEAKQSLIEAMKKHQQTAYETPDGLVVTLSEKDLVACKRKKDISLNGDGDE